MIKLYDKSDDFLFRIVNCLFICCNITSTPAYGVFIRYIGACRYYADFLYRARFITTRLLKQVYIGTRLNNHYRKFTVVFISSWIVPWLLYNKNKGCEDMGRIVFILFYYRMNNRLVTAYFCCHPLIEIANSTCGECCYNSKNICL